MVRDKQALVFTFQDGHTTFAQLSPEQRLEWVDRAARLVLQLQGLANSRRATT